MDKKALRKQYEEMKHPMGCYMLTCTVSDEHYIGVTKDLDTIKQRILFRLSVGVLANLQNLQAIYTSHGEAAFEFKILEVIPETEETDSIEENLAILLQLHREQVPQAKEIGV
ncbi:MAG: GIY-YIG nuclease family protein [Bacteroidia bacterium]|nr:GIY-YIG nuclease family protein [Bacteroidia bacterium]